MKKRIAACFLVLSGVGVAPGQESSFNELIIFGDSLSDTGNLAFHAPWNAAPSPPYQDSRSSNGAIWVEPFGDLLGVPQPQANGLGGKNYAWAAATTRDELQVFRETYVPGFDAQVTEYLAENVPQDGQLFSVWIGTNDFWDSFEKTPELSANWVATGLDRLLDAGVQDLLVFNLSTHHGHTLPGFNPELSPRFNSTLAEQLNHLRNEHPSVSIYEFDYASFLDSIVADPAAFGLTEPLMPACADCETGQKGVDIDPNPAAFYFWDDIHISAKGNQLIADEVYAQFFSTPDVDESNDLRAGDADQDFDFDQLDLVKVQVANKYLSGQAATWGEGDWNGAPGGSAGNPPAGDGLFDQFDIIAANVAGVYLQGPYAASQTGGAQGDGQMALVYNAATGELSVDAPAGAELTSINVTSAAGHFTGNKPAALDGTFDNFAADNVFKASFGGSFGSISFGSVLPAGIAEREIAADLSTVGSLAGGGDLGNVDLIYVPEPSAILLFTLGLAIGVRRLSKRKTTEKNVAGELELRNPSLTSREMCRCTCL